MACKGNFDPIFLSLNRYQSSNHVISRKLSHAFPASYNQYLGPIISLSLINNGASPGNVA